MNAAVNKPEVRIENWYIIGSMMYGDIKGHPRLGDLNDAHTSRIVSEDMANKRVETLNTIYILGKPYSEE